ncbi:outer membrane protein OmpX [Serratia sp. UGAL515B_01]|uniref:outer membrane protein OmpX n=1 Tax=Serratia sp. UGAL515B_01 TaxID=2986763 RepID=UPI002953024C|nr:outer membrane protein OmpX [Serratia sp. UGAL515B_01]WON76123.1 outer membrane protein OmpX [Serratia sp. UGAL515B_01]
MKKITCLSAVAGCVLAVCAGTAFAGDNTISAGYAMGDFQGVVNKADGFNLKYRYEFDNSQLGVIGSYTYLKQSDSGNELYDKAQYNGVTAGPTYRINDWASVYGVIGVGYGRFTGSQKNIYSDHTDTGYGFVYGTGLQFNPIQQVALDVGYEKSRIRDVTIGIWNVGVGYRF